MERFDNAVRKLYTAFHEGTLNAFDCKACAVGNICDNKMHWQYVISAGNTMHSEFDKNLVMIRLSLEKGYLSHEDHEKGLKTIEKTGYSSKELFNVEVIFLGQEMIGAQTDVPEKERQYNGLIAVVKYLAELDGIEWPDYTKLFEYNEQGAVYEL